MNPAPYGRRIGALLIDILFASAPAIVLMIIGVAVSVDSDSAVPAALLIMVGGGWALIAGVWNKIIREGRTGQSLGKKTCGIALVDAESGQPVGPGKVFIRELLTSVLSTVSGSLFTWVDYLFPLWDPRHQRVIDKMLGTAVVSRD